MMQSDPPGPAHREAGDGNAVAVASMVESIIGCKWSVRILQLCAEDLHRPSAFLRACPGLSPKVMNERLRKMIRFGILKRTVFGEKPPVEVEYRLTPLGQRFMHIIEQVHQLQEAIDQGRLSQSVAELPNLGPKSQQMLALAGITSCDQLQQLGSVAAFVRVKRSGGNPSLNLLWALEGALTGLGWQEVARKHRTSLLLALEHHERGV